MGNRNAKHICPFSHAPHIPGNVVSTAGYGSVPTTEPRAVGISLGVKL
jgi:hypothetical protein